VNDNLKWSKSRRANFNKTIEARRAALQQKSSGVKKSPRVESRSHFYRLKGSELIPVRVRKIVAWVIE
jgi:hypothetical protein